MDRGQKETERILKTIEKRINREYNEAIGEIEDELTGYFKRYEKKDETWRRWVREGERTKEEYQKWRVGQMAVGRRWADQRDAIAKKLVEVGKMTRKIVERYAPEIYAENFNYSTYQVEHDAHIDTSFTLYSKEAVERLVKDDPDIAPPIGRKVAKQIAEGKAIRWNRQQLQSVMLQGIMQGDSIPKLATRLATTVGDRDRKAAIRNARTMATGTQNAGRVDAYKRAQDKGVDLEQMWMATMDNRTRHTHRWLDGETRPVGEAFSNGCEYPGDPKGDPAEIYNCRCSLRGVVKGLDRKSGQYRDMSAVGSYDEWRNGKATSNKIDLPDEKSRNAKQTYLAGYRNNGIINGENPLSKALNRARNVNTLDDLRRVSQSPVINMETYKEVQQHFADNYNILVEGFEKKDLFGVKATLAGYDDMLKEYPQISSVMNTISYNSKLKNYGTWSSAGISQVGAAGIKDYGTGIHEGAHALDFANNRDYKYSASIISQARKNLGYRENSKKYRDSWTRITGTIDGYKEKDVEKFAYAIETAKGGVDNDLANEIYRLTKER